MNTPHNERTAAALASAIWGMNCSATEVARAWVASSEPMTDWLNSEAERAGVKMCGGEVKRLGNVIHTFAEVAK